MAWRLELLPSSAAWALVPAAVAVATSLLLARFGPGKAREEPCSALIVHPKFRWQLKVRPTVRRAVPPEDVFGLIISFLDASALCTAARVSKKWFFLSYEEPLWFRLCLRDFSIDPSSICQFTEKRICSRTLYMFFQRQRSQLVESRDDSCG